ncbi:tRNA-dependent cyclodipeptide synthase [Candidatus Odyssella thessalonicensis]|uniref:tRNA-dependent cyclodipeptide synthase n=1 Tax=Candidatus Odyssella thessalonicensis TaxID=84647 RepID=UPI000225ACAC|nr:tRNA-dependent cyclodipeptide synthase [Candidatus Odyssella thessalonicensis]
MIPQQKIDPQDFEYNHLVDSNEHALIGISPFNGYFSTQNIENLIRWASNNFKDFDIFTMDSASKYNLMAIGYTEGDAIKKTKKQDQHLQNKIVRCLTNIGLTKEEAQKKIVFISHLYQNERYLELYKEYLNLFKNNTSFRSDCLNASKSILSQKIAEVTDESAYLAVNYLLQEIPIWFNTPYILGINSSVFVYKDLPLFWRNVCYNYGLISPNQKILIKQMYF